MNGVDTVDATSVYFTENIAGIVLFSAYRLFAIIAVSTFPVASGDHIPWIAASVIYIVLTRV